jgi:cytochrome c oxidase cbb3-type subunit 2
VNKLVLIAGGSTLVYIGLAITMGVLPGIELSRAPAGQGVEPLTPLQAAGREVYVANGCSYCHTQQVRPLDQDKVFGRPSAPGDFAFQTPALLGSQRTGPDLTDIGTRQPSEVWQYVHLYNPRSVVPASIMPAFDWLFEIVDTAPAGTAAVPLPKANAPEHGVVIPTREATALVAYLASLKQPRLPVAAAGSAVASGSATSPAASDSYDAAKGLALFTANCAPCHQASGQGLPGTFPPLKGNGAVNRDDVVPHIRIVLYGLQGAKVGGVVYASPMPPFAGLLGDSDILNILNYERSAWGNHGKPVTLAQVTAERADQTPVNVTRSP